MKIISIIVLVAFMALSVPAVGNTRDDTAGSAPSKGVISRIIDGIGEAIGNVINKVAKVFKIDKEKRSAGAGEAKQEGVLEFKTVGDIPMVEPGVDVQPAADQRVKAPQQVLQYVPSGQAGVNILPVPTQVVRPVEPTVPATQPVATPRNDMFGLANVNVELPKVESNIPPAAVRSPALIPAKQPVEERKEVAKVETQAVPVIISGYAPLPRVQTQPEAVRGQTGQTARGQSEQPAIVQSGTVLGTGSTTRSPLELIEPKTQTETRSGTTDNARIATTDCIDVAEYVPEGVKRLSLASSAYLLLERNDGKKQVVSTCGHQNLECPEATRDASVRGTLIERSSQGCRPSGERPAMTDAVRDEMLGVCSRANELLPPQRTAARTTGEDLSKARFINVFDNKLLYVLDGIVRVTRQEDPARPVIFDAVMLNAADKVNITFTAICRTRDALSDCTENYDISATALDRNGVDVSGRVVSEGERQVNIKSATPVTDGCDMDGAPLTITVVGKRDGTELQKTITLGEAPQVAAVPAATEAAEGGMAGGSASADKLYIDAAKTPVGVGNNETVGDVGNALPEDLSASGGGGCSLIR